MTARILKPINETSFAPIEPRARVVALRPLRKPRSGKGHQVTDPAVWAEVEARYGCQPSEKKEEKKVIIITPLESQALKTWETNYDSAEAEKEDNCTPMLAKDIARCAGVTINQAKGVAGSLIKKGMVVIVEGSLDTPDCFWLTDLGIEFHFALRA